MGSLVGARVTHNHVIGQESGLVLSQHDDVLTVEWPWGTYKTHANRVTIEGESND